MNCGLLLDLQTICVLLLSYLVSSIWLLVDLLTLSLLGSYDYFAGKLREMGSLCY